MIRRINSIFWIVLIVGVVGFVNPFGQSASAVDTYKLLLELCLFGFSAFLVFKRVFYYRMKEDVEVIRLIRRSDYYSNFLMYGIVLALIYLVYIQSYYSLMSFNTVLISILLLYYLVQVVLNANPSLYIDSKSFSFDNYFVEEWKWKDVQRIEIEEDKLRLISNQKDFELDFEVIDEMDYVKLTNEVENNVLDGAFTNKKSSKVLLDIVQNYATLNGVTLKRIA